MDQTSCHHIEGVAYILEHRESSIEMRFAMPAIHRRGVVVDTTILQPHSATIKAADGANGKIKIVFRGPPNRKRCGNAEAKSAKEARHLVARRLQAVLDKQAVRQAKRKGVTDRLWAELDKLRSDAPHLESN